MKVFISWSGDLSHKLADEFRTWLPGALQAVQPYFTPADIEKGSRWSNEIAKELETSDVGVLFVTRDNIASSWLVYEAGALSKRLDKSRVCPVIFGISHNDLPAPLRQHQAAEFNEIDFRRLLKMINNSAGDNRLLDAVLEQVFAMWWPILEKSLYEILEKEKLPEEVIPVRSDREILEEILDLSRLRRFPRPEQAPLAEIINSLISAVNCIHGNADPQSVLNELANMRAPISRLVVRTSGAQDVSHLGELLVSLKGLNFEHQATEGDIDDEIPF